MVGDRINVIILWAKYHTVTIRSHAYVLNKTAKIETKAFFHILAVGALISIRFIIYTECKRPDLHVNDIFLTLYLYQR